MVLLRARYLYFKRQLNYFTMTKEFRSKINNIELLFEVRETIINNSFNFYSDKELYNQVTKIIEMYDDVIKNSLDELKRSYKNV